MSNLVDFSDDDATVETPVPIVVEPAQYKSVVVDTRYEPKSNLLQHLEGSAWTVTFYSQVLNRDNATEGQNLSSNPIYQQYKKIEDYEFRVTTPLTQTQNSDTKEFTVTGVAVIYPFVIPNEGDLFEADIGDGRSAFFKITTSERKSIHKDTAYEVEYILLDYATLERRTDLAQKTIASYVYRKDFLNYGQNPVIEKDTAKIIRDLEGYYREILLVYFRSFFSKQYKVLLVPGQDSVIYDHFLNKAVLQMFSSDECPLIQHMRILNVDDDQVMETTQFWDMLLGMNKRLLNYTANKTGLVSARAFTRNPIMEGVYFSGIEHLVYPKDPILNVDVERGSQVKTLLGFGLKDVPARTNLPAFSPGYEEDCTACSSSAFDDNLKKRYTDARDGINDQTIDPTNDTQGGLINGHVWDYSDIIDTTNVDMIAIPDIHKVTLDEYYVFASHFYHQNDGLQDPGMSKLEIAVCQMLNYKAPDIRLLEYFCQTYHSWGAVERFYYLPILLWLIRYTLRSV